jgi:putative ABC transport system permease protein
MCLLVGAADGFESAAYDTFKKRGEDIVIVAEAVPNQLSSDLNESLGKKVAELPGVRHVSSGLIDVISFHSFYTIVQGWELGNPAYNDFEMQSGRLFQPGDTKKALVGYNVALKLKKKVGESISVKGEEFQIIGIFRSFSVYDNDSIIVMLPDLQSLLGRKHSVTGFSVVLQEGASAKEVSEAINGLHEGLLAMPTAEYISESSHMRVIAAMAFFTSAIALAIGVINVANTMAMSVVERTREIGIFRAIGWTRWRIVKMILLEALIISIIGGIVGMILAQIVYSLSANLPQVGGFITGYIAPSVFLKGGLLAIIVGLIGGAWPSIRAASLLPTEAIYHE